jgi:metal-responsive CopG/Arc/MetJ family transcriptional regulator
MRIKTSVTLPIEIVDALDKAGDNRSRLVEEAVREYLGRRERERRDARDRAILDRFAERLNREVEDVLAYQTEPREP